MRDLGNNIDFAKKSLQSHLNKHFSRITLSYFKKEQIEDVNDLGFLKSVYDINNSIVLCFGNKHSPIPTEEPKFLKKGNSVNFKGSDDYRYSIIEYDNSNITPHIDVFVNGMDVYKHNVTFDGETGYVQNRHIKRIKYRCDDVETPIIYPQLSLEEFRKRYF